MRHPRLIDLIAIATIAAVGSCSDLDLCVPEEGTVGFFSQGDCALTKQSAFRGHEWLTFLANRDLGDGRFDERAIVDVIEGNRRVDWPKELLVHMAHSVVAYANAATELQDRPENQPIHFLLGPDNESPDAVARAREVLRDRTRRAVAEWSTGRVSALTRIGEACHTIQDSFSSAHAERDFASAELPWCIRSVKAYITRAPGHELPGRRYHGGQSDDTIGHTTSLDSIYRSGRDCNDPLSAADVERCLSDEARRARLATRDYLALVRSLLDDSGGGRDGAAVDRALDGFFAAHVAMCP